MDGHCKTHERHRRRIRLAIIASVMTILVVMGCICSCSVDRIIIPETEVVVIDAEDGEPISDAEIRIERHVSHVHGTDLRHWTMKRTDEQGEAFFDEVEKSEDTLPFVPHQPDYFYWEICVEHDGYQTKRPDDSLRDSDSEPDDDGHVDHRPPWEVTVELTPGESTPCDEDYTEWEEGIEPL